MAQQTINIGASPNDGTGTPLRTAFQYTNSNFSELYTAVGPSGNNIVVPGSATITGALTLTGGTANGVPYLNASKVVTTSDKLSFAQTGGFFSTTFNINSLLGAANYKGGIVVTEDDNSFSLYGGTGYKLIDAFGYATPNQLRFYASNAEQYRIGASGVFNWYDGAGGTRMTLNSTGLGVGVVPSAGKGALQLSSGITFPATQVASSDANTLDDYEEGTFTPTIIGTSTAGTGTYSVQSGTYTKVGRLLSCQIFLDWTAHTGTGDMRISGLPFQVSSASNYFAAAAIGYFSNVSLSAGNIATGYAINATSVITLGQYPTGGGAGTGIAMDTSGEILISVTYIV